MSKDAKPLRKASGKPSPTLSVEQRLRSIIRVCLGDPRGDPDRHHMLAAAHCMILLDEMGFEKLDEDSERTEQMRGKNLWEVDFIEAARSDEAL